MVSYLKKAFLLNSVLFAFSDAKLVVVRYDKSAGSNVIVKCAAEGTSETNNGVKSSDVTEECVPVHQPWPTSFTAGFTYLERKTTLAQFVSETEWTTLFEYIPITTCYAWRLPGRFGIGAKLEIHFQLPTSPWTSFHFQLFDKTPDESTLNVHNNDNTLLAQSAVWSDTLNTNSHNGYFHIQPKVIPYPYINGQTYVTVFEVTETHIKISYTDTEIRFVPHLVDPTTARSFAIHLPGNDFPFIEKLIYTSI